MVQWKPYTSGRFGEGRQSLPNENSYFRFELQSILVVQGLPCLWWHQTALLYPSISEQFHLTIESESTERIDLRVFNVTGQLVISEKGIEPNTEIQTGSNLANGFYFLEVTQAGFKQVVRVLKAK